MIITRFDQFIFEKVEKNKMHDLLGIKHGEKIEDHYSSGQELYDALVDAAGKSSAQKMIRFAANIRKDNDIFDKALKHFDSKSTE